MLGTPLRTATTGTLAQIHVAPLQNGTWAYVEGSDVFYYLNKTIGGTPVGSVTPIAGSPIAGNANARWLQCPCAAID